ncbi:MAG: sodium ion-translocating decarboxylase subunit beta [Oscillibacter sp.]|nr:sodium ion-translocating decarboxylase subunit beta [Oscillibacter sp.]
MGIIGGPDGPTAIFVSTTPAGIAVPVLLAAALAAVIWLFLRKRKR